MSDLSEYAKREAEREFTQPKWDDEDHAMRSGAEWGILHLADRLNDPDVIERLAKYIASAALDFAHNDCEEDGHGIEHTNWQAYTEDAVAARDAMLTKITEGNDE